VGGVQSVSTRDESGKFWISFGESQLVPSFSHLPYFFDDRSNGGKELVEEFLSQTKVQVEESEQYLRSCLKYLDLEILPPSEK
jgi:hypothetical protein